MIELCRGEGFILYRIMARRSALTGRWITKTENKES